MTCQGRSGSAGGERRARAAALVAVLSLSAAFGTAASARPLETVRARGSLSVCAHPNALPFASKGDPPGVQIEMAKAIAGQLGVGLSVAWVTRSTQFRAADCDVIMDTIVDPEIQAERGLQVSVPYQQGGVALAMRPDGTGTGAAGDLKRGQRVGVMAGSIAHMILNRRGMTTIPFGFEDEMMAALGNGEIDAAAASPASIGYFNLTHPQSGLRMTPIAGGEPDLSWNLAVGMRRSDGALRREIDRAVERILADGTVRTIYARYGIEHQAPGR